MTQYPHARIRRSSLFAQAVLMLAVLAVGILLALGGCAQNTETAQTQTPVQETVTPTSTTQDAATQGSQVYQYIYVVNSPTRGDAPNGGQFALASEGGDVASLASATGDDGGQLATAHGRYTQGGISISAPITTGGTTPSLTGSATGTGSGTQTPSQSQAVTPTQDIKPEISLSLNAAFAPGGMIDQLAAATGKGGIEGISKENAQDLKAAYAYGLEKGQWEPFGALVKDIFGIEPPPAPTETPPATPPASTVPPASQPATPENGGADGSDTP